MSRTGFCPARHYNCSRWRGTQAVRERSAKPLCVGSIPTRASTLSVQVQLIHQVSKEITFGLVRSQSGRIGLNWCQKRTKSGRRKSSLLDNPSSAAGCPFIDSHKALFKSPHSLLLVLGGGVNVSLHDSDGIVAEEGGESREINTSLGHSGSEGVAEIVEHKMKSSLTLPLTADAVVGIVHTYQVSSRDSIGRKYPS